MKDNLNLNDLSAETLANIKGGAENGSQMEGCFGLIVCCSDIVVKPGKNEPEGVEPSN